MRRILGLLTVLALIPVLLFFFLFNWVTSFFIKPGPLPETVRLYKPANDGIRYAWFYDSGKTLHIDMGLLGQMADRAQRPVEALADVKSQIETLRADGYAELEDDEMDFLQIVFEIDSEFGSSANLKKRNKLTDLLDEHFALTGQGYWVDSSSGMGTMETGFEVVDYGVARVSVIELLKGTEFEDYHSITPGGAMPMADNHRDELDEAPA